jgi:hypothetical protein
VAETGRHGRDLPLPRGYRLVCNMELFPQGLRGRCQVRIAFAMASAPDGVCRSGIADHHRRSGGHQAHAPVVTEVVLLIRGWLCRLGRTVVDPAWPSLTRVSMATLQYEIHIVGSAEHREYWIPAGDMHRLNENIVGAIEVISEFRREG